MARTRFPSRLRQKPELAVVAVEEKQTGIRKRGRRRLTKRPKAKKSTVKNDDPKLSQKATVKLTRDPMVEKKAAKTRMPVPKKKKPVKKKSVLKFNFPTPVNRRTTSNSNPGIAKLSTSRATGRRSLKASTVTVPVKKIQKKPKRLSASVGSKQVQLPKKKQKAATRTPKRKKNAVKSQTLKLSFSIQTSYINTLLLEHVQENQIQITLHRHADAEAKAEALKIQQSINANLPGPSTQGSSCSIDEVRFDPPLPRASTIDDMMATDETVMESGSQVRNARALELETQLPLDADEEEEESVKCIDLDAEETQLISEQERKFLDSDEQDDSVGEEETECISVADDPQVEQEASMDVGNEVEIESGEDPESPEVEGEAEAEAEEEAEAEDEAEEEDVQANDNEVDLVRLDNVEEEETIQNSDVDTTTGDVEDLEAADDGDGVPPDDDDDAVSPNDDDDDVGLGGYPWDHDADVMNGDGNSADGEASSTTSDEAPPAMDIDFGGDQIRRALISARQSPSK